MKELHYVALGLCVSYLSLDEIMTLLHTSKSFSYLRYSVQELALVRNITEESQYLFRLGSTFSNITNLELESIGSYNLNFQSLPKLSNLTVNGSQCTIPHKARTFVDTVHIKTLVLKNVKAPCVTNAFLFAQRLGRLTSLTLNRCLPILVAEVQQLVAHLAHLEELHLMRCFTDRNPLVLKSAPALRTLTLVNCPNMIGVYLHESPVLTVCEISNCPVSARSIEGIVNCSPNLHTLRVEKCCMLRQAVSIKHSRLRILSLRGCDNVTDFKVHCPRLQAVDLQLCTAVITCAVRSDYLRSLDLSQLSALCTLHLHCPQLHKLDVVGCESLGNRDLRRVYDLPTTHGKESLVDRLARVALDSDSEISDSDSASSTSDASHHSAHRHNHVLTQPTARFASANDVGAGEVETPGAELVRELGLHSPLLDLRHFVTQGTRATALYTQKKHLLGLVAEFCADADSLTGLVRTTPVNSPARVKKGSPRSEVKAKKPNRRSGKRRASA